MWQPTWTQIYGNDNSSAEDDTEIHDSSEEDRSNIKDVKAAIT